MKKVISTGLAGILLAGSLGFKNELIGGELSTEICENGIQKEINVPTYSFFDLKPTNSSI